MKGRTTQIFALVLIVSGMMIGLVFFDRNDTAILISSVISVVATILGALSFWLQLRRDGKLNQAKFIMDLQKNFFEFDLTDIKNKLYKEKDYSKFTDKDSIALSRYIVFFENMAPMLFDGVLTFDLIDDLFSFNFFLCTNHPIAKKDKIIPHADGFRGIIRLHKLWTDYKKKKDLPILMEETSLDKGFADYNDYATGKNLNDKEVRL